MLNNCPWFNCQTQPGNFRFCISSFLFAVIKFEEFFSNLWKPIIYASPVSRIPNTQNFNNCYPLGTWFNCFPITVAQPNLVSSFLRTIPRGIFEKLQKSPFPPWKKKLRKTVKNECFLWFSFSIIIAQPNLVSSFLRTIPRGVFENFWKSPFPSLEKTQKNSIISSGLSVIRPKNLWFSHFWDFKIAITCLILTTSKNGLHRWIS